MSVRDKTKRNARRVLAALSRRGALEKRCLDKMLQVEVAGHVGSGTSLDRLLERPTPADPGKGLLRGFVAKIRAEGDRHGPAGEEIQGGKLEQASLLCLRNRTGLGAGAVVGHSYLSVGISGPSGGFLLTDSGADQKPLFRNADAYELARKGTLLDELAEMVAEQCSRLPTASEWPLRVATFAFPSPVDVKRGTLSSRIFDEPHGVPIHEELVEKLADNGIKDCTIKLANDADVLARGHAQYGAARIRGATDFVYVKAGAGVGVGILINNRIPWLAYGGGSGEIGHSVVPLTHLPSRSSLGLPPLSKMIGEVECSCRSKSGHLESLAGVSGLTYRIRRSQRVRLPEGASQAAEEITRIIAEEPHDCPEREVCVAAVVDSGRLIGRALHTVVLTLNPEKVFLGGRLAETGTPFLEGVQAGFDDYGAIIDRRGTGAQSGPLIELAGRVIDAHGHREYEARRREIALQGAVALGLRNTDLLLEADPDKLGLDPNELQPTAQDIDDVSRALSEPEVRDLLRAAPPTPYSVDDN